MSKYLIILSWHEINYNSEMLPNWIKMSDIFPLKSILIQNEILRWWMLQQAEKKRIMMESFQSLLSPRSCQWTHVPWGYSVDPWFHSEFKILPRDYIEIPLFETKFCYLILPLCKIISFLFFSEWSY